MVTIDRECLISEKQNNIASAEGARLQKEAMLLSNLHWTRFVLLDSSAGLAKGQEIPLSILSFLKYASSFVLHASNFLHYVITRLAQFM